MNIDQCVNSALATIPASTQASFVDGDPLTALRADLNLTVTAAPHLASRREGGGACDGMSFLDEGVILYAPTPDSRRENFTLAHELGHWAVEHTPDVYDWLADEDDPLRMLETICDRVAARLLLPDQTTRSIVGAGPVRADHLLALYDATSASRPACAIALVEHLPGLGAIAIVERSSREVTHSSVRPDPARGWPKVYPWKGHLLDSTHPLLQIERDGTRTRRLDWVMPWDTAAQFYVNAIADDKRVYAVLSAADLWNVDQFHASDDREYDQRLVLSGYCCGTAFEVRGFPCSECDSPFCPRCKRCRCDRDTQREVRCQQCFLNLLPHLVVDGLCADCR